LVQRDPVLLGGGCIGHRPAGGGGGLVGVLEGAQQTLPAPNDEQPGARSGELFAAI
jgi:hypothetical protein